MYQPQGFKVTKGISSDYNGTTNSGPPSPRTGFLRKPALRSDATTELCARTQLEKCSLEMSAGESRGTPHFQVQNRAKNEQDIRHESSNDSLASCHVSAKTLGGPPLSPQSHVPVHSGVAGSLLCAQWVQREDLTRH